jgi:hypothetical protein
MATLFVNSSVSHKTNVIKTEPTLRLGQEVQRARVGIHLGDPSRDIHGGDLYLHG